MVDDEKTSRERVTLAHKEIKSDNPSYYETELLRAVESIWYLLTGTGTTSDENSTEHV
ncbi:hypothetical protein [Haloplanus vescus]|jgi:hypothetical protein|uniref:hypothetical protein n=1 Tax=Halobacteriales TaxID=2235 RepID=UPI000AEFEA28